MWNRGVVEAFVAVKLWKTVVAGLIVVALGAYILAVEKPRMEAESREDRVVDVKAEDVSAIRLQYPDSPTIRVERSGDGWHMSEPVDAPADGPAVDRLLKQIVEAKAERRIPGTEAQDPEIYGLEGSGERARVTLYTKDGSELPDIIVGKTTPVGFQAFVRIEGKDEVIVTPLIFHTGVKKRPFDLRDKSLLHVDPEHVVAISLTRKGETIRLERSGDDWSLVAPRKFPADKNRIQGLIGSVNNLRATAFFSDEDADREKFGLTDPSLEISLELGEEGSAGFRLGKKDEGPPVTYYFERTSDGQVAKVAEWVKPRFDLDLDDLRDKRLFRCKSDEIASIRFERADGAAFALDKDDQGKWTISPPSDRALKEPVITRTVGGLASLSGKDIVADDATAPEQLAPWGLDNPALDVEVRRGDDSSCGHAIAAVVGADSDNPRYYVKRTDEATVMSVPEYLYSRLDMVADDFLAPKPEANEKQAAGGGKKKEKKRGRKKATTD